MEKPEKYQRQRAKKRIYVDSNTGQHLTWHEILNLIPSWQDRSNAPDVIRWPSATAVPWTCTWERSTRLVLLNVTSVVGRCSTSRGTRRSFTSETWLDGKFVDVNIFVFACRRFKIYSCPHCSDKYCTQEDLERHLLKVWKKTHENGFKCTTNVWGCPGNTWENM